MGAMPLGRALSSETVFSGDVMSSISLVSGPAAAPVSRNRLLLTSGLGWMFDALDVGLLAARR